MSKKSDIKPLAHYPSAMAQGNAPLKMPIGRRYWRTISKLFGGLVLLALVAVSGLYMFLSSGPVSNERLRQEMVSTLSSMMGPELSARISKSRISIGNSGLLSIAADQVSITRKLDGMAFGNAGEVRIGLKVLPLLSGKFQVESVLIADALIDVKSIRPDIGSPQAVWPDALHLEKLMQIPAKRLHYWANEMTTAGLKKLTWRNLRLNSIYPSADKSTDLIVHLMEIKNGQNSGDLSIELNASLDGRAINLSGNWTKTSEGFSLNFSVVGLDASDIIESASRSSNGFVGLDAPLRISYSHPYDENLRPLQSTIRLNFDPGLIRFDRNDIAEFSGGQLNLRIIPEKNQIELEKSPVKFGATSAVLTGGIRFPLTSSGHDTSARLAAATNIVDGIESADNLVKPTFEFIANNIIASPSDSPEEPVQASLKLAGTIDAVGKVLELSDIQILSEGGDLQGAGRIGFSGETPSLALALDIPNISMSALKQLWPLFVAPGARRWILKNLTGGTVSKARITAAIPAGILGKLQDGKKIARDQLNIELDVEGVDITLPDDLPAITAAKGTVVLSGMETLINLEGGKIIQENGETVEVEGGRMEIGNFQLRPTMAKVDLSLVGSAPDILRIGSRNPLQVARVINIDPDEISGDATVDISIGFPLQKEFTDNNIDWSADIKLKRVSLEKPLAGYKITRANVAIKASPGIATINGNALVDGIPAKLALSEPFGSDPKGSIKRSVKLSLDSKARLKLGLDLDGILVGPVSASFEESGGQEFRRFNVDLTRATLTFPWANWVKGKGIKASAKFDMRTDNGITKIRNFELAGKGFGISGIIDLDKKGLRSAKLSRLSLNRGDNIQISARRTGRGYIVDARGKSYDARAIINQVINKGTPKSKATKGFPITLKAQISNVLGFGGETLNNVTLHYSEKSGRLANASMEGLASGRAKTSLSIKPKKGETITTLVSDNAGSALRFLDIYKKIKGGSLTASLRQQGNGPHKGKVILKNFNITGEPRLKRLLSVKQAKPSDDGRAQTVIDAKPSANPEDLEVTFVSADITKSTNALSIENGILRAGDVGSNFSGNVYDASGNMNMKGTYLPGYGLNRIASKIPIVGLAFGDGTKRGLLGITYRLRGKAKNPKIQVNPISVIAPGIFRKVFEFR